MPEIALNPPPFNPVWEKGAGGMRGHRRLPLLSVWEKGAGGMRGQTRTGMPKTGHLSDG